MGIIIKGKIHKCNSQIKINKQQMIHSLHQHHNNLKCKDKCHSSNRCMVKCHSSSKCMVKCHSSSRCMVSCLSSNRCMVKCHNSNKCMVNSLLFNRHSFSKLNRLYS